MDFDRGIVSSLGLLKFLFYCFHRIHSIVSFSTLAKAVVKLKSWEFTLF